jgi:hypothetical protein
VLVQENLLAQIVSKVTSEDGSWSAAALVADTAMIVPRLLTQARFLAGILDSCVTSRRSLMRFFKAQAGAVMARLNDCLEEADKAAFSALSEELR